MDDVGGVTNRVNTQQETREQRLSRTFVTLADSLVAGFDVVELLEELVEGSVRLFDILSAGIMLSDQRGNLRVLANTSETSQMLELLELQNDEGPCLEAFRGGTLVASPSLVDEIDRWPRFVPEAVAHGVGAAYALPLRLRDDTLGAMNLFCPPKHELPSADLEAAQALADVATIAILSHRAIRAKTHLAEELQTALNSRVTIEQAKGVLAERGQLDMGAAFQVLRRHARDTRQQLSDVAADIVSGALDTGTLLAARSRGRDGTVAPAE